MEKQSPERMRSDQCLPRLHRGNNTTFTIKSNRLSPMTHLLERFREAVFRVMMVAALSKGSNNGGSSSADVQVKRACYNPADPFHNEAVADCIEFIKKSSSSILNEIEEEEQETNSESVVLPVPVG